jgi:polyisoprenoid-binding protein YceI
MSTHHAETIAPSIAATRWRIDPTRSRVEFQVKFIWGMSTVKGGFSRYHGTLDLTAQPAIELTVEADSLDTSNDRRDAHLRSRDFFDAETHPSVRFVSEAADLDGDRLTIRGRLHARGTSIPLSLEATLRRIGDELEVEAVCEADHRELGTWNKLGLVSRTSTLMVKGRLVRDS